MDIYIESIGKLVNEFSKLPGVGKKTAQRYAYKVIDMPEAEAKAFADAIIGAEEPSKPSIVERVRGWFSTQKPATKELPNDVNILHLPEDALPHSSTIAFEEGQCRFRATQLSAKEDPSLEGYAQTHNAQAYAEDMMGLKHRAL